MPAPAPAAGQRAQVAGTGLTATPQPSVARSQQAPATTPSPGNASASDAAAPALRLHPPLPLYPLADPAQTPSALGSQPAGPEVAAALAQAVAQLRPAMVLVLGHVAARAALGRPEPLGRLRAEVHQLAGCPAVVTYDPAFLLRSQDNKAAAWADLCRALALVRAQERPSA